MYPIHLRGRDKVLVAVVCCTGLLAAGAAIGQQQKMVQPPAAKVPLITSLFPAGGQRGASADIDVKGKT